MVPEGVGLRLDVQNTEIFRLAEELRRGVVIDVVAVDDPRGRLALILFFRPLDPVDDHRRPDPRTNRLGVQNIMFPFGDQLPVAVGIHQKKNILPAKAPPLRGDEEVFFRQRIGAMKACPEQIFLRPDGPEIL